MLSLELKNVDKRYGNFYALKNVNMQVEKGEFIVMVGPSGCGKSTLLKSIAGLELPDKGKILINGKDVTKEEPGDRGIAMVFQSYALYPHMSVAENMGFGLRMAKRPKAEIEAAVKRAAGILRLEDQLEKLPRQLSGGQRQRVAIGRAITRSPEVFLFDEPLSNLDAALRTQMRVELSTLHSRLDATMIYVTHDQIEAMTMADKIVVLNAGAIEQIGSPKQLYRNPDNYFVAGFLGAPRINFFEAKIVEIRQGVVDVEAPAVGRLEIELNEEAAPELGMTVTLGVRPEALHLAEGDDGFPARIHLVEYLGRETIVYADATPLHCIGSETGTGNMTVHLPYVAEIEADSAVMLTFDARDTYLFGGEGQRTWSARK